MKGKLRVCLGRVFVDGMVDVGLNVVDNFGDGLLGIFSVGVDSGLWDWNANCKQGLCAKKQQVGE